MGWHKDGVGDSDGMAKGVGTRMGTGMPGDQDTSSMGMDTGSNMDMGTGVGMAQVLG